MACRTASAARRGPPSGLVANPRVLGGRAKAGPRRAPQGRGPAGARAPLHGLPAVGSARNAPFTRRRPSPRSVDRPATTCGIPSRASSRVLVPLLVSTARQFRRCRTDRPARSTPAVGLRGRPDRRTTASGNVPRADGRGCVRRSGGRRTGAVPPVGRLAASVVVVRASLRRIPEREPTRARMPDPGYDAAGISCRVCVQGWLKRNRQSSASIGTDVGDPTATPGPTWLTAHDRFPVPVQPG